MKPEVAHALWVGAVYFYHCSLRSIVLSLLVTSVWLIIFMLWSLAYGGASFHTIWKTGWNFNSSVGPIWTCYYLSVNAFYAQSAAILFGIVITLTMVIFFYQLFDQIKKLQKPAKVDFADRSHLKS